MKTLILALVYAGVITVSLASNGTVVAADKATAAEGPYQIVKSTADRVWRLNTKTGEIAVCTLEDVNLICTNSTEAIKPPATTYEEREAERVAAAEAAKEEQEAKKAKDLELIDKFLDAIKSLVRSASEQETAN